MNNLNLAVNKTEISDDIMEIPQIISYDDDWVL